MVEVTDGGFALRMKAALVDHQVTGQGSQARAGPATRAGSPSTTRRLMWELKDAVATAVAGARTDATGTALIEVSTRPTRPPPPRQRRPADDMAIRIGAVSAVAVVGRCPVRHRQKATT